MHHLRSLAMLAATLWLGGCGTTIFHATFQADTLGSLPNLSPPENPSGDSIFVSDTVGAGTSQLSVVSGSAPDAQALRYANVDIPLFARFVGFMGTEITPDANADLFAYWTGRMQGTGSPLQIWLGSASTQPLAGLLFQDGAIRREVSSGRNPTYETIGSYVEGGEHFILISLDGETDTWRVTVTQSGQPFISSGPHPVLDPAALGTTRPTIYLWFSEETGGTANYVIDDVWISHRPPEP